MMRNELVKAVLALLGAAVLAALAGCASGRVPPEAPSGAVSEETDPFAREEPTEDYRVRPGDTIRVHFLSNPDLNVNSAVVRADGKVSLPVVGDLLVAGKTSAELGVEVREAYNDFVERSGYGKLIRAGDELQLRFTYNPQLNQRVFVRPDGKVSLLLLGELLAEGVPYGDFEATVRTGYAKYIKEPEISIYLLSTATKRIYTGEGDITVMIASTQPKQIFVGGEVMEPAMLEFRDRLTPLQAIMRAKGLKETADPKRVIYITQGPSGGAIATKINLAAYIQRNEELTNIFLRDGDVIIVPRTGIAKLNLAVRQYVRDAMPLESGLGFSYLINRDWVWR